MLTYDLDRRGDLALYDYLYRCIKGDILAGRLKEGEKLPSKRALAQHLEVAVVTVENAYAQLTAEGYVRSEEKRGYYVNQVETGRGENEEKKALEEEPERQSWLLDLRGSGSGTEGFPFSVWARLMRRVITEEGKRLLRSMPHNGVEELREALARHIYQFRGISARPEQIVVGAGTEYLYNLIVQLLGRELVYGVEDPGYDKAVRIYELSGARCVEVPVDEKGACLGGREAQVLHVSPNHQFPTGTVMPIARRQHLLAWAEERTERYIIEDDYDSEFRFTLRPIPTLRSIDRNDRVIYLNTFSRSLAPSLRISYLVLPLSLLERYRRKLGFYSCTVPAMEQYTLAKFLEEGHFERHVNRMRVYYRSRRDAVLRAIENSPLSGRCRVLREDAGLHFLLELDTSRSDGELEALAGEQGIRLSFLSHYARVPGTAAAHMLVVNYPGVDLERLDQALEILSGILS